MIHPVSPCLLSVWTCLCIPCNMQRSNQHATKQSTCNETSDSTGCTAQMRYVNLPTDINLPSSLVSSAVGGGSSRVDTEERRGAFREQRRRHRGGDPAGSGLQTSSRQILTGRGPRVDNDYIKHTGSRQTGSRETRSRQAGPTQIQTKKSKD